MVRPAAAGRTSAASQSRRAECHPWNAKLPPGNDRPGGNSCSYVECLDRSPIDLLPAQPDPDRWRSGEARATVDRQAVERCGQPGDHPRPRRRGRPMSSRDPRQSGLISLRATVGHPPLGYDHPWVAVHLSRPPGALRCGEDDLADRLTGSDWPIASGSSSWRREGQKRHLRTVGRETRGRSAGRRAVRSRRPRRRAMTDRQVRSPQQS